MDSFEFDSDESQEEFISLKKEVPKESSNLKMTEHRMTIRSWNSLTWICHYCNLELLNGYNHLKSHLQSMHNITNSEEAFYQCVDCKTSFRGYALFINHIRGVHYKDLRLCCDVCDELLPDFVQISLHRDRHNEILREEYPVIHHCTLCENAFPTEKELKTHIQLTHSLISLEESKGDRNPELNKGIDEVSSFSLNIEHTEIPLAASQCKEEETVLTFQCSDCVQNFTSEGALQQHSVTHNQIGTFECEFCCLKFPFKSALENHQHTHSEERLFQCHICQKSLKSPNVLRKHLYLHTDKLPFKCGKCEMSFATIPERKKHMRSHSEIRCEYCQKCFGHQSTLKAHYRIHTSERSYECETCSKKFWYKSDLTKHIRIHTGERPYQCEICLTNFMQSNALKIHKFVHSDVRPFQCERCEKSFKSAREVKYHMRVHDKTYFPCEKCKKKFVSQEKLWEHVASHDDKHKCDQCERYFGNELALARHKAKHTLQCILCTEKFENLKDWRAHLRNHTEDRNFECDICLKKFRRKDHLTIHKILHFDERPLKCELCGKGFTIFYNLKKHAEKCGLPKESEHPQKESI